MFETKNIAFGQETSGKDTGTYLRAEHSGRVYSKGADAVAEGAEGDYRAVLKARVHGAGGPRAAAVKIASDQGLDNELYIYSILPELDIFSRIRDAFEREVPSDTPREVMLFMEREARTLSDLGQALDNPELKRTVAHKVVSAVNTLHKVSVEKVAPSGIVHLDIKPSNFMLSSEGKVKIYDFGFAQVNDDEIRQPWDHLPGTPKYMEPNAVTTRFWDFSLKQADLFSVGATLYELAHGRAPDENFPGYSDAELHRITGDGPIDSLEKVAALLMHENPASRPTLDAVLEMPYFNVENGFLSEQQMADELKNLGLLKEPDTPRPSFSGIAE